MPAFRRAVLSLVRRVAGLISAVAQVFVALGRAGPRRTDAAMHGNRCTPHLTTVMGVMLMPVMAGGSRIGSARCDRARRDYDGDQGAHHDFSIRFGIPQ